MRGVQIKGEGRGAGTGVDCSGGARHSEVIGQIRLASLDHLARRLREFGLRVELEEPARKGGGGALELGLPRDVHRRAEREDHVGRLQVAVREVGGELARAHLHGGKSGVGLEGLGRGGARGGRFVCVCVCVCVCVGVCGGVRVRRPRVREGGSPFRRRRGCGGGARGGGR